jgi:hypothetical protein
MKTVIQEPVVVEVTAGMTEGKTEEAFPELEVIPAAANMDEDRMKTEVMTGTAAGGTKQATKFPPGLVMMMLNAGAKWTG